jgi:DUF177 domain-containing protein
MKREFDADRLDVAVFAKDEGRLEGKWPLDALARLAGSVVRDVDAAGRETVNWQAEGELRQRSGAAAPDVWLHARARTSVVLECQRCLKPMTIAVEFERSYRFVHGEETAADLDLDSDDDVLALTRSLDLRELVEDELLLALPLVPRHDVCPEPLNLPADPGADEAEPAPNPFAGLAALKRGRPPN